MTKAQAIAAGLALVLGGRASAQSLLDRPPNVSGNWVGTTGQLYFNFLHRFTTSDKPEQKISNAPTFLVAGALPWKALVGFNYSSNSTLAPRYPNEWEFFLRYAPLAQDENAPLDLGAQVDYNLSAEGLDGELSLARRQGPLRVIAAARLLSDPLEEGKALFAFGGGTTLRLGNYIALAGDVATLSERNNGEKVAWSAGIHLAIPNTPHTLSLHASNVLIATLQGLSRGGDDVRYGFEFTIPITLRRFFPSPASPPTVATPAERTDTAAARSERPAIDTARAQPPVPQPAPAVPRDTVVRDTAVTRVPVVPAPRDTARAVRPAQTPGQTPATPSRAPTVRRAGIRNMAFTPTRIEVDVGSTVEWRNNDAVPHTVTALDKSFDSGIINAGATWRRTFSQRGTFNFQCTPHPFMKGVVVVR